MSPGLLDEARDVVAVARQAGEDAVGVARQPSQGLAVRGEDVEHAIGLAQRRHAAADRRLEVVAARGQAHPELREDEPEALAGGAAQDAEHDVGRDRRRGLLDRDGLRRRLRRLAGIAVEVVLADERLRLDLAEDVLAKAGEVRARDLDRRERAGRRALDVEALRRYPTGTPDERRSEPSVRPKALSSTTV